jgi:hypothetical protein
MRLDPMRVKLITRHRQALKELLALERIEAETPEAMLSKMYQIKAKQLEIESIRQEAREQTPSLAEQGFFNTFKAWYLKPFRREEIEAVQDMQESGKWKCPEGYEVELDERGVVRRVVD